MPAARSFALALLSLLPLAGGTGCEGESGPFRLADALAAEAAAYCAADDVCFGNLDLLPAAECEAVTIEAAQEREPSDEDACVACLEARAAELDAFVEAGCAGTLGGAEVTSACAGAPCGAAPGRSRLFPTFFRPKICAASPTPG